MKYLIVRMAFVGFMALTACNSGKHDENLSDSGLVDTMFRADSIIVDTTPQKDQVLIDSITQ